MKTPKFLKKKRNIWIIVAVVIVIIAGWLIFGRKGSLGSIQIGTATKQNLVETVLSTGQVVSEIDLSLSFQGSGVVRRVSVKEGDKVEKGQTLASLDSSSALANLTSAQGSLAQAQANYDKLIVGTTWQVALDGANNDALNALDDVRLKAYNALAAVTNLQNTYFTGFDQSARDSITQIKDATASLELSLNTAQKNKLQSDMDSAVSTGVNSLNIITNALKVIRDTLDTTYYYGIIPDSAKTAIDVQRANINGALTSVTNNQQAISNAKISLLQSGPEIDLAKAQILSAQGQVDAAQAVINNNIIRAPENGTITQVDVRVGELATPSKEAIVLQNITDLHAEADVSEANVATLQAGQDIDYTFDALGPDQHFAGKVLTINPASTVISGVVNYKVKGSLENVPNVKPGMTANMTILVAKKDNVLAVPSTAVINKNNKQYVRVIDDPSKKTYHEVEVKTGLQADGGLVEILSGIKDGQAIVTYVKP